MNRRILAKSNWKFERKLFVPEPGVTAGVEGERTS